MAIIPPRAALRHPISSVTTGTSPANVLATIALPLTRAKRPFGNPVSTTRRRAPLLPKKRVAEKPPTIRMLAASGNKNALHRCLQYSVAVRVVDHYLLFSRGWAMNCVRMPSIIPVLLVENFIAIGSRKRIAPLAATEFGRLCFVLVLLTSRVRYRYRRLFAGV